MPSTEPVHRPYVGVFATDAPSAATVRKCLIAELPGASAFSANTAAGMAESMAARWPDLLVLLTDSSGVADALLRWAAAQGRPLPVALVTTPNTRGDGGSYSGLAVAVLEAPAAPQDIAAFAARLLDRDRSRP